MNDWTELTPAPIMGRSVQPAHIFFQGDAELAQQRVGIARKILGYVEYQQRRGQLGYAAKQVTLADGSSIRAICHGAQRTLLIDVQGVKPEESVAPPAHGYQFYTTTPTPQFIQCTAVDYYPAGSAVFARVPDYDPFNPVPANTVEIKAVPTGSFVDRSDTNAWPYYSISSITGETCDLKLNKLSQAMNRILKVNSWQVNGIAEYVSYHGQDFYNVVMANPALHQSWVQGDLINSFGLKTVLSPSEFMDQMYDAPPSPLGPWEGAGSPKLKTAVPDSDWFGRAGIHTAVHQSYGKRTFVIMSAADGAFHCWPVRSPLGGNYSAEYGAYGGQAYKGNIVKEYARVKIPDYPDWVFLSESAFRDLKDFDEALLLPRCTWSFNENATSAISVMIERKVTKGTFKKINYAPNDLGWSVYKALNKKWGRFKTHTLSNPGGVETESTDYPYTFDPFIESKILDTPHIPAEESIEPLQVFPTESFPEFSEISVDRMGFVEIAFAISLTGPNLNDYTFSLGVSRSGTPDEVNTIEHGMLVEVAYARPLAWQDYAAINKIGSRSIYSSGSLRSIFTDDVVCLFVKAYRHTDQDAVLDAYDGEVTLPEPSKVKAIFGKGYPKSQQELFKLPLAQIYGRGYTYTESNEDVLPPDPHLFVSRTNQTMVSEYPYAPENTAHSKILYTYKAKITDLDLGSFSFYYHVRCVAQERKETTIPLNNGLGKQWDWHPIEYKSRSWCVVSVMGKVVDESAVGHNDVFLPWLQGWVYSGGAEAIDVGENIIDPNEKRSFRGFGKQQGTFYPMRARRNNFGGSPFTGEQRKEHLFVSYREQLVVEPVNPRKISWSFQESNIFKYYLHPINYSDNYGVTPWFLCGACAAIFNFALAILYFETYNIKTSDSSSDSYSYEDSLQTYIYSASGTASWGISCGLNLYTLTEESTKGFMQYVYNLFSTFYLTQTGESYGFVEERNPGGSIHYNSTTTVEESSIFRISDWLAKNPFLAANPKLSAATFAETTYKYFWNIIKYFQAVGPQNSMAPEIDWNNLGGLQPMALVSYFLYGRGSMVTVEPRIPPHLYILPRGSGTMDKYYNKVYPYIYNFPDLYDNQHTIHDFEYGNLVYTHLLHTHFSPVINDQTSSIRLTPEGHFSYCKQDIFEFSRAVVPEAVFYADYLGPEPQRNNSFSRTPGTAIPWGIEYVDLPNYAEELTKNNIDWKPLEGVGWFYGALRCSHRALYNKAYKSQGIVYYSEDPVKESWVDFKPEFKITSAPGNEGYLVNPVGQYNQYAYDWRYWIYPWGQPPWSTISSNELYPLFNNDRRYIRLSPLFF